MFFATNLDADAEFLKERLREAIEDAYEDPARPRKQRYLSDEYLDLRIEKAREFVANSGASRSGAEAEYLFDDEDELVDAINRSYAHGDGW